MGGKQLGSSDYELKVAKNQAKREQFLSEMEVVVPSHALIDLIEPHYPKASKRVGASLSAARDAAGSSSAAVVFAQRSGNGRGPDRGAHHATV